MRNPLSQELNQFLRDLYGPQIRANIVAMDRLLGRNAEHAAALHPHCRQRWLDVTRPPRCVRRSIHYRTRLGHLYTSFLNGVAVCSWCMRRKP